MADWQNRYDNTARILLVGGTPKVEYQRHFSQFGRCAWRRDSRIAGGWSGWGLGGLTCSDDVAQIIGRGIGLVWRVKSLPPSLFVVIIT